MSEQVAKQLQLQRMIERALDNFKKLGKAKLTPAKIRSRISSLKETWILFLDGHAGLSRSIPEATRGALEYFKDGAFETTEDCYQTSLDYMTECLEELEPPVSPHSSLDGTPFRSKPSPFALDQLPSISLPSFDGTLNQWEHFRDRFTSIIIDNSDLSDFARMHYLTSCLTGRASACIRNISVTAGNFKIAWRTLSARYASKRRLLNAHLSTLFNLAAIPRESAVDLSTLHDTVNLAIASLENLQRTPEQLWSDVLVYIVVQRLDPSTRKAWSSRLGDDDEPPSFADLSKFLTSRARALEEFAPRSTTKAAATTASSQKVSAATASASAPAAHSAQSARSGQSAQSACPICKKPHYLSSCPAFASSTPSQRRELVKQHRRCFNCFSSKHSVKDCSSKYSCRLCQSKHHTMLHMPSDPAANGGQSESLAGGSGVAAPASPAARIVSMQSEVHSLQASPTLKSNSQIMLATAWVTVSVASGRAVAVRALLDQGSEVTFISENLAQILRARRVRTAVSVTAVGGVHAGTCRHAAEVTISPRDSRAPAFVTNALILKNLTSYAPRRGVDVSSLAYLADLQLADSDPTSSASISLIIGADIYHDVIRPGLRKGGVGQPVAQKTVFGWVLSGPLDSSRASSSISAHAVSPVRISVHHSLTSAALEADIRRFWEIEELPRQTILSAEDEQCEKHFRATHSREVGGRYIVRLPFKRGPPIDIGDSRHTAKKLFASLSRRLRAHPELSKEYADFLQEYESLGHMRHAPPSVNSRDHFVYIPHHPVLREGSATTHLRVVFNASNVTSNGSSLNDHLLAGPKLQLELPAVLLTWRQFKDVYIADIAKMYRQIQLDSRDVDFQRILWTSDPLGEPRDYQLLTVTYGMKSAPFLALRVLQQLESDEGRHFPLAAPILRDQIYVDDVLFGGDNSTILRQTRDQLVELLRRGGFELRKWASNNPDLLSDINPANHGLACKSLSPDENLKILGIGWNPSFDVFQVSVALGDRAPESKRSILSAISKLFDPLGWVTPVTISAKIFMQQLWREKLDWDEIVPAPLLTRWIRIYAKLSCLKELRLARWTAVETDTLQVELHGFADASNMAYAAAVYLKVVSRSGKVTITLLAGKSKVAPLTFLSIPRLELCAAVLLARLLEFVRKSLRADDLPCFCWTDSMIVLAWLKQHPSRWKTFVANRVANVQTRLPNAEWRHVATNDNPADCASRGLLGDELIAHSLWWRGPSWLEHPQAAWPHTDPRVPSDAPLEEKVVAAHCTKPHADFGLASRFSSWPKLIRVTAYIFRFVSRCRSRVLNSRSVRSAGLALTASECQASRLFWIKKIQSELFSAEIFALERGVGLSARSQILSLRPMLDSEGVLRVGGRLRHSPMPLAMRHPILLSAHPLVQLIVENAHTRALHAGIQLTLSTLRRDYWLLRARSLVKSTIHRCVTCVRERAAIPAQLMGDLPAFRVTAHTRSFLHCGLDYAGPMLVRASAGRGIKSRKAYIALFVCLATRAIHLELVSDYTSAAFTHAFSRFCARRGLPSDMYSDNGTTFVGADRDLTSAYRTALRDPTFRNATASDNVSWHFMPPSAPHFGGIWEAGVKSVKHHLRRVVGSHTLTFEELSTLLCRVEACLNSRPIAPLSDTLDDYEALTPGHFLIGSALTVHPEPSLLNLNENRLSRWQLVHQITERFWKVWYHDYVNTLQQRSKWRARQPSVTVGQLVLLRSATSPPCKWELGRVTQCHSGADGLTRVVTVKTANSEYKRPVVKLCILPVACEFAEK